MERLNIKNSAAIVYFFQFYWPLVLVITLFIVVGILTWLLKRRDKTITLIGFTFSLTGLKLTYELNKDMKLDNLVLKNTELQNQIEELKSNDDTDKLRNKVFLFLLVFVVFMLLLKSKLAIKN